MTDKTVTLPDIFYFAADHIHQFGWKAGGGDWNADLRNHDRPACIYLEVIWTIEDHPDLPNRLDLNNRAVEALEAHFNCHLEQIFDLNDTIPTEDEGREWAISHLETIAAALSGEKETVTAETCGTDTGNVTNVDGPVKRLLKQLRLVKSNHN